MQIKQICNLFLFSFSGIANIILHEQQCIAHQLFVFFLNEKSYLPIRQDLIIHLDNSEPQNDSLDTGMLVFKYFTRESRNTNLCIQEYVSCLSGVDFGSDQEQPWATMVPGSRTKKSQRQFKSKGADFIKSQQIHGESFACKVRAWGITQTASAN